MMDDFGLDFDAEFAAIAEAEEVSLNPLENLKREIAQMRASITDNTGRKDQTRNEFTKYTVWARQESDRLYAEYNENITRINNEKARRERELADLLRNLDIEQDALRKKEAELAALMELENQRGYLTRLKGELDQICLDFPAYFKAHIYQHEDLLFIADAYERGTRGILNANGLGLGKTFESAVSAYILQQKFIAENNKKPRILWLTKKSLVSSSPKEIKKWWPAANIMTPAKNASAKDRDFLVEMFLMLEPDILLCNYEFIRTTQVAANIKWDLVIIDEVHKLKGGANANGPTAIWTAIKDVCGRSRFVQMLSGTPMVNAPEEMWSYLHILRPDKFPTLKAFKRDFCFMRDNELVVDADQLLKLGLKGQMIRRTAEEVGLEVPDNTIMQTELDMNEEQKLIYEQLKKRFFVWLDEQEGKALTATSILAQLIRLRQINVWPAGIKFEDPETGQTHVLDVHDSSKIDEAMDIIEQAGEQIVVFSTFNEPFVEIERRVKKLGKTCATINGSTKSTGDLEWQFQQGKIDVLCINSAMGEGLNLQKSKEWPGGTRIGILLDKWYSPARNDQCIGRYARQGQTHACMTYILENKNSVDQFIDSLLDKKNKQFGMIMDSDTIRPQSEWRSFLEGML